MEFGYIFTWMLALWGTSIGWAIPFIGLMVYYAFAILRPNFLWFWAFDPYNPPRFSFFIAISTLIGWAFAGFGNWNGLRGCRTALFGLGLYLFCGVVGWQLFAVWQLHAWNFLSIQLKIGLMTLVTVTLIRDARSIRIFIWVVVAALGYQAFVFNEWYQISAMYLHNNGFGGIDNNGVGMIMVMSVPLSFFMAVYAKRLWVKALCFAALVLQVHVIMFSYSRGSQLGLCMVGGAIFLVALFTLPRKMLTLSAAGFMLWLTLVGLPIVGLKPLAGDQIRERFVTIFADPEERDASASSRFVTWNAGWNIMINNPLGVGPRNAGAYTRQYGLSRGKAIHNLYLQTGADYGILGLLGLMTFYLVAFFRSFFLVFRPMARQLVWPYYIGVAVSISLGGFLICSTFIGMESVETGFIVSLLGLTTVCYVNRVTETSPLGDTSLVPELVEVPPPNQRPHDDPFALPGHEGGLQPAYY